jgi:hypothetical protein
MTVMFGLKTLISTDVLGPGAGVTWPAIVMLALLEYPDELVWTVST